MKWNVHVVISDNVMSNVWSVCSSRTTFVEIVYV